MHSPVDVYLLTEDGIVLLTQGGDQILVDREVVEPSGGGTVVRTHTPIPLRRRRRALDLRVPEPGGVTWAEDDEDLVLFLL